VANAQYYNSENDYDDSAFVNECFFSSDGRFALVSEFENVTVRPEGRDFDSTWKTVALYGLYQEGIEGPIVGHIAMSVDSVYFFTDWNEFIEPAIPRKEFMREIGLNVVGLDISNRVVIKWERKFSRQIKTSSLRDYDGFRLKKGIAKSINLYDYYLTFAYDRRIIHSDTIREVSIDTGATFTTLKTFVKKVVYYKSSGEFRGTDGYPSHFYTDSAQRFFFIRAAYSYQDDSGLEDYDSIIDKSSGQIIYKKQPRTNFCICDDRHIRVLRRLQ
jgi:hypothetical protein